MNTNIRRTLAVGGTAAAIVGIGGTAMAVTGTPTPAPSGQTGSSSTGGTTKHHAKGKNGMLKRLEHGQFVTRSKKGTVTHTIYRGDVTAVSPSSITVQAADKKTQTYVVDTTTRIRERAKGSKPAQSSIGKIVKGDHVTVSGIGTSRVVAKQIVETAK